MAYLDYTGLSIFLEKIKDLLSKKQNTLTFDTTPTSGSTNPVTSGGIYTSLESKADLTSPTFEGTPKAPTAAVGTNSTQIATTAFVKSAVGGKQDTIADLNTIRSGAALGATALQSYTETDPVFSASAASGITSTDISNWNAKVSNVQADWNQTTTTAADYIKNKPTIPTALTSTEINTIWNNVMNN